jgi:hypothetical protein
VPVVTPYLPLRTDPPSASGGFSLWHDACKTYLALTGDLVGVGPAIVLPASGSGGGSPHNRRRSLVAVPYPCHASRLTPRPCTSTCMEGRRAQARLDCRGPCFLALRKIKPRRWADEADCVESLESAFFSIAAGHHRRAFCPNGRSEYYPQPAKGPRNRRTIVILAR